MHTLKLVGKKGLAIILIALIASLGVWFAYDKINGLSSLNSDLQDRINELQSQNEDLHDKNEQLEQQVNLLEEKIDYSPKVRIMKFRSTYGWMNVVGMTIAMHFNITIKNLGVTDLEGLTVEIKRQSVKEDAYNITRGLEVLPAGEETVLQDDFIVGWDTYFGLFHNVPLEASVKLGDVVLDKSYLLPPQYL